MLGDFDPPKDGIYERITIDELREKLHNALVKLEIRDQDVARLDARNAHLERELKLQGQHYNIALKDNIMLKQQLAELAQAGKPGDRRGKIR